VVLLSRATPQPVAASAEVAAAMSSTAPSVGPGAELAALYASGHTPRHVVRHDDRPAARHVDERDHEHDEHPVAAVLALKPRTASADPALLPRPATGPGHLTSR
jgi:hypothetical protein